MKKIDWDKLSTAYSKKAIERSNSDCIRYIARDVHNYWIKAVYHLWGLLEKGYKVNGGYTEAKRISHKALCIPYDQLDIKNKLKDCYMIKKLVSKERWESMKGYQYDYLFDKYKISW